MGLTGTFRVAAGLVAFAVTMVIVVALIVVATS
jgi:hypothetical protein